MVPSSLRLGLKRGAPQAGGAALGGFSVESPRAAWALDGLNKKFLQLQIGAEVALNCGLRGSGLKEALIGIPFFPKTMTPQVPPAGSLPCLGYWQVSSGTDSSCSSLVKQLSSFIWIWVFGAFFGDRKTCRILQMSGVSLQKS